MEVSVPKRKIIKLISHKDQIDQTVKDLYNVKKEIISKIEQTKQKIRIFCSSDSTHEKKPSIIVKDRTVSLLDRDISHIQNLHDVVVQDLEELKRILTSHIAISEKTELIMNILNYKLYEIQFTFRSQFDKLKEEKENLTDQALTRKDESTTALRIFEIDDEITKLEDTHQKNLECIKEQKLDAQKAYERATRVMDENLAKMANGLNKLLILIEAEKSNLNDSQAQLIDSKFSTEINNFKADIEKFTELQTTGWKVIYPEEKISELLQQRGIKVLQSGQLITEDGQAISFKQAKASKIFDDMSPEALKELKASLLLTDNDETIQSTVSSTSTVSKMSSEDANYLKQCLGKPLVLALAEITRLQPRDPIHYLGHWLFKYRYNQQMEDINSIEFDIFNEQRTNIAKEKWHKFIEEEARAAVMDMITHAEEIAIMNELKRIKQEAEAMEEMEGLDDEARDTLGAYNGPSKGQMPL